MRHFLMAMAAVFAASLTLGAAQAQTGIGYVDVQRIVAESPQGVASAQRIDAERRGWQAKITAKQDEVRRAQQDAQARAPVLSDAGRLDLQADIERKISDLRRLQDDATRELAKISDEELKKIEKLALPAIEAVRRDALLAVVVRQEGLLAADPSVDLTDAVIAKMAEIQ